MTMASSTFVMLTVLLGLITGSSALNIPFRPPTDCARCDFNDLAGRTCTTTRMLVTSRSSAGNNSLETTTRHLECPAKYTMIEMATTDMNEMAYRIQKDPDNYEGIHESALQTGGTLNILYDIFVKEGSASAAALLRGVIKVVEDIEKKTRNSRTAKLKVLRRAWKPMGRFLGVRIAF